MTTQENTTTVNQEQTKKTPAFKHLVQTGIPKKLKFFGFLYFVLSLIGGIVLIATSFQNRFVPSTYYSMGEYVKTVNAGTLSLGITGVITSVIIFSICLGIARIIEQNNYLIIKLNEK